MANHIFFVVCCLSTILIGCNYADDAKNGKANEGSPASISASSTPNGTHTTEQPPPVTTSNSSTTTSPTTSKPTTKPTHPTQPPSPPPHSSTPAPGPSPTNATTVKPSTTTTSAPPTPSPSNKDDRSFDLPSFIGGVILSLGLAAIGYVVYKFYRTRTDPNYRTL